ncbi:MAG: hypothetical protein K0B08_01855 [Bacteroidales bacterium]|nr:hypothetical protein [Bacteroidales bacterium]
MNISHKDLRVNSQSSQRIVIQRLPMCPYAMGYPNYYMPNTDVHCIMGDGTWEMCYMIMLNRHRHFAADGRAGTFSGLLPSNRREWRCGAGFIDYVHFDVGDSFPFFGIYALQ